MIMLALLGAAVPPRPEGPCDIYARAARLA